jgi:TPR repeat protein
MKNGRAVSVLINVEVTFHLASVPDTKISRLWSKAKAGDTQARLEMSKRFFRGHGVPKDEEEGLDLLQRAAESGSPEAQFLMGEHAYAHGGDSANFVDAYVWYSLAEGNGYSRCKKVLEQLNSRMTPEQLSQAKARLQQFSPKHS